ncbi:RING/U-box [Mortierella sp. GBAus27b]|nr:RING/U-box [Mortierella sp. GBAus27b]
MKVKFKSKTLTFFDGSILINRWNTSGNWRWDIDDPSGNCGICHFPLDASCPQCKMPGDQCALLIGKCSHCFHLHCITQWLRVKESEERCPMDRQPFEAAT